MNQIIAALESAGAFEGIDNEKRKKIEQAVFESRIKDIIEFTRAVHAETDAIISVARSGKPGLVGSTLYCNTFPCHNCTKHIIDAGVSRVVYLDPYEKSLARKLHGDAMLDTQHGASGGGGGGVVFDMYGGLSPSRYGDYFPELKDRKRKDSKTTKFVDLDRKRTTIDPIGAQEKDVLESRINRVVKAITKIATRIKIGGQNSADVPAKQAKGKSEAKA